MSRRKIAIVGTNGIPARYGGFETLVEYLTRELSDEFEFTVYCSSIYDKSERYIYYNNSRLIYIPLKANGFQSIFYDLIATFHAFINSEVIIVLGPAFGFLLPLNFFFRRKLIVNHGGLNEWDREKLSFFQKKYAFWSHKLAAISADVNIVDNVPLSLSIKNSFNVDSRIIEYGGDHIKIATISNKDRVKFPFLNLSYDLSISRAQPDNNLHLLLETYKEIPQRNLVLISNWNISSYGIKLKEEYLNKFANIYLVDAIYNMDDLNVIRSNTSLYVHSHSQCGTAPSLVEAMNYNIPIICFDVETNRATTQNLTFYFKNKVELYSLINNLTEDKLRSIKSDLFSLAREKYLWSIISNKYGNLFC